MPIQIREDDGGKFLAVHVSGLLSQADYESFVPECERLVQQNGKLRVLFDMAGFHGWEAAAIRGKPSSTPDTSQTSNAFRWSGISRGSTSWRSSANCSRKQKCNTSIIPMSLGRGVVGGGVESNECAEE